MVTIVIWLTKSAEFVDMPKVLPNHTNDTGRTNIRECLAELSGHFPIIPDP